MNNQRSQRRSSMMVRLVAVLAVTMMFTMCFVGGTFAKYTSSATGTDNETEMNPVDGSIIAPGTQGSFDLVLKNESQVTAQYAIDYTVTNNNDIPVKFSVDGGTTWTNDLADVAASDSTKLAANSGTTTIKVQWKWDFNGSDDNFDTALGIGGNAVLTVKAEVTATQVD